MEEKTLFQIVNEVEDENSFIAFLEILMRNRIDKLNEWQNDTIEDFLSASQSWAKASISGLEFYLKSDNPWKRCAQIIYMGKIYE